MNNLLLIEQAALSIKSNSTSKPPSSKLVAALLEAEKNAKKDKIRYSFEELLGSWRLCFITGTKKARSRAGIVLGSGIYVPEFLQIQISYSPEFLAVSNQNLEGGSVENTVQLGALKLSVAGPVNFIASKNIQAFDFTRITLQLLGMKLYGGYVIGGRAKESQFYRDPIGKQAFFTYFLIQKEFIAARGRGGGLALWSRA